MKILMAHNYYRGRGGEEVSFESEAKLLENNGHDVYRYTKDNRDIESGRLQDKITLGIGTIWAKESYGEIISVIKDFGPDVAHFQNTFPQISPSVYYACQREGVPVVQSIRNYRLMCPAAIFFRNGEVCELCAEKFFAWPGIWHACYRDSRIQSAVSATMSAVHRLIGTWKETVDAYIALSGFGADKIKLSGIPIEKVFYKPNLVHDPGVSDKYKRGRHGLYLGRLSPEKGILDLLEAWGQSNGHYLQIVGDGPLRNEIEEKVALIDNKIIEMVGWVDSSDVFDVIRQAGYLLFPTRVYETFGRSIMEAYASGIPVIASRIGAIEELVDDNETGLLFESGDIGEMVSKIDWMEAHPDQAAIMGVRARKKYEEEFSPQMNYKILESIYQAAIANFHGRA